ncbi:FAD-dependent monooxygenase [Ktedonosporobacter rubrisoli]|uniref:FAD-dependent monooxygenase n=1 Tax=Ktedonosporobacter rubrisoli TaxID=2509675 RepID=A0A4P6JLF3_KTERU|nr:FAD-dependent monooxygenase [Ktedonosporobacter rubrisoli]QBD75850.1 FAD-dependent monooxygenase [Ktedonosporobacter rubrisoli]
MQKSAKKVLIIGAGIGGAALALFLKRAGLESEIYEAREQPEGFSLTLASNGVAVLKELGLDQATMAEGSVVSSTMTLTGKNKQLGEVTIAGKGLKSVFIKRVPLGRLISEEAERQGIKITRGKRLQNIDVTEHGSVVASFQDGTQARGDMLIGCDGVHSHTRKFVDPAFPGPVYSGLINSGGYTSGMKLSTAPESIQFVFGRRAFFGYHIGRNGYAYWFTNWPHEQEPARGAFDGMTDAQRREEMLTKYAGELPIIKEIIEKADETFPYFLSYTLPQQPQVWHRGPVVLLGDAAHAISPSSGQGASMALEDAVVLAKCLRDIPDQEQALITYEHLRRERTTKIYKLGVNGDLGKHKVKPFDVWFRDLTTPIFLKLFANPKATEWIYSYQIDWNAPVVAQTPAALSK